MKAPAHVVTLFLFLLGAGDGSRVAAASCTDVTKCEEQCPCLEGQAWNGSLAQLLNEFKACNPSSDDTSDTACNVFLARALVAVYKVKDFGTSGAYLNSTGVVTYVKTHPDLWTLLGTLDGTAQDQQALNEAQGYANLGKPVIAVKPGHVALIVPGKKQAGWGALTCHARQRSGSTTPRKRTSAVS